MENVVVNEVENAQVENAQVADKTVETQVATDGDIRCRIVRIVVEDFDDEDTIRLVVDTNKLNGFVKQADETFTPAEVDYVRFRQAALTAQLCEVNADFATYRSLQKERLSRKQLAVLLAQAKLCLSQRLVVAGEPIDDNGTVKDHDIYVTTVKAVQFNKSVVAVFNTLTERILFGALDL